MEKQQKFQFSSPITGHMIDLSQVSDPVFSQRMMGDGFAIDPTEGKVVAPFDGFVEVLFPTGHAIGLSNGLGLNVLIHVGLNTFELKGNGFTIHTTQGATVKKGDLLLEIDIDAIKASGKTCITPIIFTDNQEIHCHKIGCDVTRNEAGLVSFL